MDIRTKNIGSTEGGHDRRERFNQAYLRWLEEWPRRVTVAQKPFDQCFTLDGSNSLWWSTIGLARVAQKKPLDAFWQLWQASDSRSQTPSDNSDSNATPQGKFSVARWAFRTTWNFLKFAAGVLLRKALAHWLDVRLHVPRSPRPALVLASRNPNYVRDDGKGLSVWFWAELLAALKRLRPDLSIYYRQTVPLLDSRRSRTLRSFICACRQRRRLPGSVPAWERFATLGDLCTVVWHQWKQLWRYARLESRASFRASMQFEGRPVSELLIPELRRAFERAPLIACQARALSRLLQQLPSPKVWVLAEELYEGAVPELVAARRTGVRTIGVQHGNIHVHHLTYRVPRAQVERGVLPDLLAVYGRFAQDLVTRLGHFPQERVVVTGAFRLDGLTAKLPPSEIARQALGLPPDARVILVLGQTFAWLTRAVEALVRSTAIQGRALVAYKPHPRHHKHEPEWYQSLRALTGNGLRWIDGDFYACLSAADVVVGHSSTGLMEALLAGRRVVVVNLAGEMPWYPYDQCPGVWTASSETELVQAAVEALDDDAESCRAARQEWLRQHVGPALENEGSHRLAQLILACLEHRAPSTTPSPGLEPPDELVGSHARGEATASNARAVLEAILHASSEKNPFAPVATDLR